MDSIKLYGKYEGLIKLFFSLFISLFSSEYGVPGQFFSVWRGEAAGGQACGGQTRVTRQHNGHTPGTAAIYS